jgi:vanillate O-demethylase ferredoxin subunit
MTGTSRFDLTVTQVRSETPLIRAIRLARPHGEPLPSWQAGAHIDVRLPGGDERSYSLISASADPAAMTRPASYLLGVRLEEPSTGGSAYMHSLRVGDSVNVSEPANNFPLEPAASPVVLLAGGIGVTPLVSMAAALTAGSRPYRFYYAGRSRAQLAFLPAIEAVAADKLAIHTDDTSGIFDVCGLMTSLRDGEALYCCGPRPMLDAALATAKELGWPPGRLHFEIFTTAPPRQGDAPFEVVLKSSGESFLIPADKTILGVLIEAGHDPLHDCKRGDCGICQVGVIEGVPDHRDYVLSDAEKAAGKLMQICVSRSKTPRLVIDL